MELAALDTLIGDDSSIIIPPDKGRITVVMAKTDYVQKAMQPLSDSTTYLPPAGYRSNNETRNQDQENPREAAGYAKDNPIKTVENEN